MRKVLVAIGIVLILSGFWTNRTGTPAASEYPDKPAGLKKMVQDLLNAEKNGDQQKLKGFWQELKIPNSDQWFVQIFGERFGSPMAETYKSQSAFISKTLDKALSNALRDKMTEIEVVRFDRSCDSSAGDAVYPLLAARQKPQVLYEAKLANGSYWTELFAFAYVDGGFRYIPQPKVPQLTTTVRMTRKAPSNDAAASGDDDDSGTNPPSISHQVPPLFPEGIGRALTDSVRLNVLISTDGTIKEMYPTAGRCEFVEAVEKAVKKWTFSPGKANGEPYESWFMLTQDFVRSN